MEKTVSEPKKKTIGYQAPQFNGWRSIRELGPAFQALVKVYKIKAAEEEPCWYEKGAGIYFMYEGRPYHVGVCELETDSDHFACIQRELIEDLYKLGAYEMFYSGMMD